MTKQVIEKCEICGKPRNVCRRKLFGRIRRPIKYKDRKIYNIPNLGIAWISSDKAKVYHHRHCFNMTGRNPRKLRPLDHDSYAGYCCRALW